MAENGIMSDFFARDEPSFRHRRIRRIRRIWLSCPNPGRQRPSWKCRSRRRHRRCFEMLWIGSSSRILQKSFRMFFSNVVHAFFTCWGLLRPVYFHLFSFSLRQLGLTCRVPSYATPRPRNWRLARSSRRSTARLDTGEMCRGFTDPNFVFVMIGWHVLELVDLLTLCIVESGSSAGHDATIGHDATSTSAVTNHRKPHLSTCCMFVLFHIQLIFESQHPGDWFSISSFWEVLWGTQGVVIH